MQRILNIVEIFLGDHIEANLVFCDLALSFRCSPHNSIVPDLLSFLRIFLIQSAGVVVPIDFSLLIFSFLIVQFESVHVQFEFGLISALSFSAKDFGGTSIQAMYILDEGRNFTMPFVVKFDGFVTTGQR